MNENEETIVSVFCLTYNHATYIKDAMESFLKQKTTFKFNIFIFDDASTDGTSEIVLEYGKTYSNIMDVYVSPINIYKNPERENILNSLYQQFLKGKYIALCEGDDYWIDELKLQKQIDFMEKNKDCSMITHAFKILDCQKNCVFVKNFKEKNDYLSPEEIILQPNGNLATASLVMKRKVFLRENGFPRCDVEDVPLQLCAIYYGEIYYLNEVMSVYRYMHKGSWTRNRAENIKKSLQHSVEFVDFLIQYNIYTKWKFDELIWKKIIVYLSDLVEGIFDIGIEKSSFLNSKNSNLMSRVNRILGWFYGCPEVTESEKRNIQDAKHIFILGKGKYSMFVKKSLEFLGYDVERFVVSRKNMGQDDDVYTLNEISNIKGSILVVGINQKIEDEILKCLSENKIYNFITPLWFKKEDIMIY